MQFTFNDGDGSVSISGEFTFSDNVAFRDLTARLLQMPGPRIVIDVAQLAFIDSAGLGMLLIVRDEAEEVSRKLVLRGAQGQVQRMFAVTRFDTLFTVEA